MENKDERDVQVLNTNRKDNTAYVALCGLHPFGSECRHWTNTVIRLDLIEKLMRCKFEDGQHYFVAIKVSETVDIYADI